MIYERKFGFQLLGGMLMASIQRRLFQLLYRRSKFQAIRYTISIWRSTAIAQDATSSSFMITDMGEERYQRPNQ